MSEVKAGQIWQECDNRFTRLVEVQCVSFGRVVIRTVGGKRDTIAFLSRFNGKHGGYKLIQEAHS